MTACCFAHPTVPIWKLFRRPTSGIAGLSPAPRKLRRLESVYTCVKTKPRHLPSFEVIPRPVDAGELKGLPGLYAGNEAKAGVVSVVLHALAIALILLAGSLKPVQKLIRQVTPLIAPTDLKFLKHEAGGGGGARQPVVKKDQLPKPSPRQFTPPKVDVQEARIMVAPTINADLPDLNPTNAGVPDGLNALMNGPGARGGFGGGPDGGIGSDLGPGAGKRSGGGGPDVFRIGADVSAPKPVYTPEPEYSEEARKAKYQGTVLLSLVVDEAGRPVNIHVTRPLGLGLDEKAVEAVRRWTFKPGTKNGKAVAVQASVEVNFRLL